MALAKTNCPGNVDACEAITWSGARVMEMVTVSAGVGIAPVGVKAGVGVAAWHANNPNKTQTISE